MADDLDRRLNPFRYDSGGNLTPAARRQDTALLADGVAADADGRPVLRVTPPELLTRAGECDAVARRFEQECAKPAAGGAGAGGGMAGFRSAGAFATLDSHWEADIRYVAVELMGTYAQDLRDAAAHFTAADGASASALHR